MVLNIKPFFQNQNTRWLLLFGFNCLDIHVVYKLIISRHFVCTYISTSMQTSCSDVQRCWTSNIDCIILIGIDIASLFYNLSLNTLWFLIHVGQCMTSSVDYSINRLACSCVKAFLLLVIWILLHRSLVVHYHYELLMPVCVNSLC